VTEDDKDAMPELGGTKRDVVVSMAKGVVGAIPGAGSFIAEIIGQVIPEQRIQRIEVYIKKLNERLEETKEQVTTEQMKRQENVDLFEDGATQAARALSDERLEYIARLVAHGMSGDERARLESKRLLSLLRSVDDDQIIILASYLRKNSDNQSFREAHAKLLAPISVHLQSPLEERERATVQRLTRDQLKNLGLFGTRFASAQKGKLPEFDEHTGMMKASGTELTPLGRLFLTRLGLSKTGEF
jgi:hypothetical protein